MAKEYRAYSVLFYFNDKQMVEFEYKGVGIVTGREYRHTYVVRVHLGGREVISYTVSFPPTNTTALHLLRAAKKDLKQQK